MPDAAPYDDPILYLMLRKDMNSLNHAGKMVAQGAHAANHAADQLNRAVFGPINRAAFMAWEKSTDQAFGTTIVLGSVFSEPLRIQDIHDAVAAARQLGYAGDVITDPTYPLFDGGVTHLFPCETAGWIFGSKAGLGSVLKYLTLHTADPTSRSSRST